MHRKLGIAVALAVALAVSGYAQKQRKKPDFSGTWAVDTEKSESAPPQGGGPGGGRGPGGTTGHFTIKQTADSISIEGVGRQGAQSRTYKLDNSEQVMK